MGPLPAMIDKKIHQRKKKIRAYLAVKFCLVTGPRQEGKPNFTLGHLLAQPTRTGWSEIGRAHV